MPKTPPRWRSGALISAASEAREQRVVVLAQQRDRLVVARVGHPQVDLRRSCGPPSAAASSSAATTFWPFGSKNASVRASGSAYAAVKTSASSAALTSSVT